MTPGQTIRQAREEAGLTARELAERVGVAMNTIVRWERDEVGPSIDAMRRVGEALGRRLVVEYLEHQPPDDTEHAGDE
jgi:transcriptional regulator with XRE-family HTH domain